MSTLAVRDITGIAAFSNTVRIPTGHTLSIEGTFNASSLSSGTVTLSSATPLLNSSGQPLLRSTGQVVQVVYAELVGGRYDISSQDIASFGLQVQITPTRTTSQILLMSMINHSATYVSSFGFLKNGSRIGGTNNTNSANAISTIYWGQSDPNSFMFNSFIQHRDTAGTTSAITYAVAACSSWAGGINTLRINDRSSDMASTTNLVAMEIIA